MATSLTWRGDRMTERCNRRQGSESLHSEKVGPRAGPQHAIVPRAPARQVENQNQARRQRAAPPICHSSALLWVRARHGPHQANNRKLIEQQTPRRDSGRVPPLQNLSRAGSGGCGRICVADACGGMRCSAPSQQANPPNGALLQKASFLFSHGGCHLELVRPNDDYCMTTGNTPLNCQCCILALTGQLEERHIHNKSESRSSDDRDHLSSHLADTCDGICSTSRMVAVWQRRVPKLAACCRTFWVGLLPPLH